MANTPLAEIVARLRSARRVLAITHISPDGDAIGSLLGFAHVLRAVRGAEVELVLASPDGIPAQLRFLPGASEILTDPPHRDWDAVIALDASDTKRLGSAYRPVEYGAAPVIVLDHHVTNLRFGTLNYVEPAAAATAQVVVDLADAFGVALNTEAAVCLLTGLVTDTLSFRTSNVTAHVMALAVRLIEAGADLAEISQRALAYRPLGTMRMWGLALTSLRLQNGVLWTTITHGMRCSAGATENGDGGLTSYLINAPEANVAAVFSELPDGRVEVGFRARPGYDVSGIALSLGGGGHPQAAGCTIAGPLADAEARVLALLLGVSQLA
jgi:phosphoesterase RecJ-like protein